MRAVDPDELRQYIRQVLMQEEHAFGLKEGQAVEYNEFHTIVETVANAAAHWTIGMARDDSDYDGEVAPPLPERPSA